MSIPDYKGHTITLDGTEFMTVIDKQERRSESYNGIKTAIDNAIRKVSVPALRYRAQRVIDYNSMSSVNRGNTPAFKLTESVWEINVESITQDGTKVTTRLGAERIDSYYDPADAPAITAVLEADFNARVVIEQTRKAALDVQDAALAEAMKQFKPIDAAWLREQRKRLREGKGE